MSVNYNSYGLLSGYWTRESKVPFKVNIYVVNMLRSMWLEASWDTTLSANQPRLEDGYGRYLDGLMTKNHLVRPGGSVSLTGVFTADGQSATVTVYPTHKSGILTSLQIVMGMVKSQLPKPFSDAVDVSELTYAAYDALASLPIIQNLGINFPKVNDTPKEVYLKLIKLAQLIFECLKDDAVKKGINSALNNIAEKYGLQSDFQIDRLESFFRSVESIFESLKVISDNLAYLYITRGDTMHVTFTSQGIGHIQNGGNYGTGGNTGGLPIRDIPSSGGGTPPGEPQVVFTHEDKRWHKDRDAQVVKWNVNAPAGVEWMEQWWERKGCGTQYARGKFTGAAANGGYLTLGYIGDGYTMQGEYIAHVKVRDKLGREVEATSGDYGFSNHYDDAGHSKAVRVRLESVPDFNNTYDGELRLRYVVEPIQCGAEAIEAKIHIRVGPDERSIYNETLTEGAGDINLPADPNKDVTEYRVEIEGKDSKGNQHNYYFPADGSPGGGMADANVRDPARQRWYRVRNVAVPPSPTHLNPSGNIQYPEGTNEVTLSWRSSPGAVKYWVRMEDVTDPSLNSYPNNLPGNECGDKPHYLCKDNVTETSITVPVQRAHTYRWWVHAVNSTNTASNESETSFTFLPASCLTDEGPGLLGHYYMSVNQSEPAESKTLLLCRRDSDIDFSDSNWRGGSPESSIIPDDFFQVQWTGWIRTPESGYYHFELTSDDGTRLYIDGKEYLNYWRDQAKTKVTLGVQLSEGWHTIRIDYYERGGFSKVQLAWNYPLNSGVHPVPSEYLWSGLLPPREVVPAVLAVTPESLTFSGKEGQPNPSEQSLQFTNTGDGIIHFTSSSDSSWLSIRNSETQSGTQMVSVDTVGLAPKTYEGKITITSADATNAPITIPVHLIIEADPDNTPPTIRDVSVSPLSLSPVGGTVSIRATVTDDKRGVGLVYAEITLPNGNTDFAILMPSGSDIFSGEYLAPPNNGNAPAVYHLKLKALDDVANGSSVDNVPSFTVVAPQPPEGKGLFAQYFNNQNLSGFPAATRIDPVINFDWGQGSPAPGVNPERFSVRWYGQVQSSYSENYTFSISSDDGSRLWVSPDPIDSTLSFRGRALVSQWQDQAETEKSSLPVQLEAGKKYYVLMEMFDNTVGAIARLKWSSPSTPKQTIPKTQLFPLEPLLVSPTKAALKAGEAQKFTLTPNVVVSWTVESDGTVNQEGIYTAPSSVMTAHVVKVMATDTQGNRASAAVSLVPPPPSIIHLSHSSGPAGGTAVTEVSTTDQQSDIAGAQFTVHFDPGAMNAGKTDVSLGPLLPGNPNINDSVPGQLRIASASAIGKRGPGVLLRIVFHLAPNVPEGTVYPVRLTDVVVVDGQRHQIANSASDGSITIIRPVPPVCVAGDVNGDKSIDVSDAVLVLKHLVQLGDPLTGDALHAADATKDGTVNVEDAVSILQIAVGLIEKPLTCR